MKKQEQKSLLMRAIEVQTNRLLGLESGKSNPTIFKEYCVLSGKIDAYTAALQMIEGNGVSIKIDCC